MPHDGPVRETATRRRDGEATAKQVIEAAERLFAERGIEAVSLREVSKAAGSSNPAVSHYYFGGKDGLLRAIMNGPASRLNRRRLELLEAAERDAAGRGQPVAPETWVQVLALPIVEELDEGRYVGFLARLANERHRLPLRNYVDDESVRTYRQVSRRLHASLPGLDRRRFEHRRDLLVQLLFQSLATRQHAEAAGGTTKASRAAYVVELIEAATGLMLAPVGPDRRDPRAARETTATRQRLKPDPITPRRG